MIVKLTRIFTVLLISVISVIAFSVTVLAADTALKADTVEVYQGVTTAEVSLYIKNNQGLISVWAMVGYDPALKLVDVRNEKLIQTSYCGTSAATLANNPYTVYLSDSLNTTNIMTNGKLVTLTFEVPADASVGTEYAITFSDSKAYDCDIKKIPLACTGGKIKIVENKIGVNFVDKNDLLIAAVTVKYGEIPQAPVSVPSINSGDGHGFAFVSWDKAVAAATGETTYKAQYREFLFGDADSDGVLSILDGIILSRYLGNWTGYEANTIDLEACDANLDGTLDLCDGVTIWRHLARWSGYATLPKVD